MKTCIVFLLFLFSYVIAPGQSSKIDSLKTVLKNADKKDASLVNTLNQLANKYCEAGIYDSALAYNAKSQALAEKLSYDIGIADALTNLAYISIKQNDFIKASTEQTTALPIYQKAKNKNGIAHSYTRLGYIYEHEGDYFKALDYMFQALAIYKELNDKLGCANNMGNIGDIYYYQGNYADALKYELEAYTYFSELGDKEGCATTLPPIGGIYSSQKNYPKALEYMSKGLDLSEKIGDKAATAYTLSNMGAVYASQHKYAQALDTYNKALTLFREINDVGGMGTCLLDMSLTESSLGNRNTVLENTEQALALFKKIGYTAGEADCYEAIGRFYLEINNFSVAKRNLDSALYLSKSGGEKQIIADTYEVIAQLDSTMGNYKAALENYEKHYIYYDSLTNEANTKKIIQTSMNYEFEQKQAKEKLEQDKKDAIRNAEEIKHTAEYKTQKIITILIASFAVILILLVILIFQRMRGTEKEKLMVEQQKSWLELKALRTQMNPHFLYNTINSIQSFVLKNDTKSSVNYLAQFASLMRGVLENSRKDKITLADEVEGLFNYLDFETMRFPSKFNYQIKIDSHLDKNKTLLPPLLIQPYVENAIWHGLMHLQDGIGQVTIMFEKIDGHIMCVIDDNGIGRKAAKELRNKSLHKPLGMSIVAERMESMNKMYHWDMKVRIIDKFDEGEVPAGTRVEVYLPLILNTVLYD